MNIKELAQEIIESLEERRKGISYYNWATQREDFCQQSKGKGTKQYTLRRIDILQDELKQVKKDLINGKYDLKKE